MMGEKSEALTSQCHTFMLYAVTFVRFIIAASIFGEAEIGVFFRVIVRTWSLILAKVLVKVMLNLAHTNNAIMNFSTWQKRSGRKRGDGIKRERKKNHYKIPCIESVTFQIQLKFQHELKKAVQRIWQIAVRMCARGDIFQASSQQKWNEAHKNKHWHFVYDLKKN